MTGLWDAHYRELSAPEPYGDSPTYQLAADWVKGCARVEDWGCGKGWLRQFIPPNAYVGVDGSCTPFADVVTDLATYRSVAEGVVLRHVLEHSHDWQLILRNALATATRRLFVAVFTPIASATQVLFTEPAYGDVPVIAFSLAELVGAFGGDEPVVETVASPATYFGVETVFRVAR